MYFHVLVEVDKEKLGLERIIEYDIASEKELFEEYVIPFVKKESLSIDGYEISPNYIKRFIVKSSDTDINSLLKIKYSGVDLGWMMTISALVMDRDDTNDITKRAISAAKSMVGENHDPKKEKLTEMLIKIKFLLYTAEMTQRRMK